MHLLGQPRLNFDVLRLVCHSLTRVSDALSFALTCSELTEDAFRRRLRMSPIRLSTEESIDSFYRFIFAKEAARAPYIYGLKLPDPEELYSSDFGPSDPQFRTLNDCLVTILQAAIHLEYIFFPITDNLDPVLTIAAKMTSLCELSIYLIYDSPWEFLSTFRSSLRSLDIREGDIDDSESVSAGRLHNHLANFAPTLEVLKLQYFNNFDIMPSFVTTQFTAVRSLTISNVILFDHLTMEILLRLFPGLDRTLDLDTLQPTHGEDVYLNWREVNKDIQKTRAWPRLDRLVCEAEGVFLMALQCPIRHMETRVPCDQKRYLAPALRHHYPQRLHCVVTFVDGLDDLDGELFPSEGAERLTHLSMVARLEVGWPPKFRLTQIPWPQFRDKMIASLSHLRRLTHLRLVFHCDVFQHDPESDPTLLYATDEADLQLAATELARTIPTLQYVFLINYGKKRKCKVPHCTSPNLGRYQTTMWLSSKGWQVVRHRDAERYPDSGSPSVVDAEVEASCTELSSSAADRIIDQEELYLPRDEEDTLRDFTKRFDGLVQTLEPTY